MRGLLATLLSLLSTVALAKEPPSQVITWPETGAPVLRFTFGKFKDVGSFGNQRTYVTETTAENIGSKSIGSANFSLYLFDKNKTRIGEAIMIISDLSPGGTVKFQTTVRSPGAPVSLSVVAKYLPKELGGVSVPAKVISITVNTVPQGAVAKLDGVDAGITPKIVRVSVGKHVLEFSKEGFSPGKFPFEIGPDDVSGGSVSFELGTSAHDTIELRDGTVVTGDLVSVSGMDIVIKVGGSDQRLNRNQVKRILLVEREAPAPENP